ncbi:MAG: hypothetical protein AOA65_0016 [Candidatus Bathyarchaeota archaeon BA1]|nr:MAG: hypothetical protein AOA65_0016 [Candidatus Bathyarchaeota archaeon BA1]
MPYCAKCGKELVEDANSLLPAELRLPLPLRRDEKKRARYEKNGIMEVMTPSVVLFFIRWIQQSPCQQ